ncbi:TnsA endonuclease C-terminal domain-containing protein [Fictibacillus norfolkensis]|uniref:TnsA endonuclease C-terminal domain-containing protein n=1 Tax=Fictibacillus norfolkensis TaxID=2762233 RepID=UPI001CD8A99A|nr:TnsA endonuclease C-terminal domain-containing protein [Fictibacillus norfolkensis]
MDTRPNIDEELISLINEDLFKVIIHDQGNTSISKLCLRCDKSLGIENGTSMFILKHMLATKKWSTDMNTKIKNSNPLKIVDCKEPNISRNKNVG